MSALEKRLGMVQLALDELDAGQGSELLLVRVARDRVDLPLLRSRIGFG